MLFVFSAVKVAFRLPSGRQRALAALTPALGTTLPVFSPGKPAAEFVGKLDTERRHKLLDATPTLRAFIWLLFAQYQSLKGVAALRTSVFIEWHGFPLSLLAVRQDHVINIPEPASGSPVNRQHPPTPVFRTRAQSTPRQGQPSLHLHPETTPEVPGIFHRHTTCTHQPSTVPHRAETFSRPTYNSAFQRSSYPFPDPPSNRVRHHPGSFCKSLYL